MPWQLMPLLLVGRVANLLQPYPCEVANSIGVFRELSWLTGGIAKVKLDRKAAGLRLAYLLRLRTAIGLIATISKLYCDN